MKRVYAVLVVGAVLMGAAACGEGNGRSEIQPLVSSGLARRTATAQARATATRQTATAVAVKKATATQEWHSSGWRYLVANYTCEQIAATMVARYTATPTYTPTFTPTPTATFTPSPTP